MNRCKPIRSVLVVGGGSAGWIAASLINSHLGQHDCKVTLLESSTIGTIGVGEATTPDILQFAPLLNLSPEDFMRRCQATYKLGIKFVDWQQKSGEYWHPFGPVGGKIDGLDLFHYWLSLQSSNPLSTSYASYSIQRQLSASEKAPRSIDEASHITAGRSHAYHLDATSFAATLKGVALERGVEHHYDEVCKVNLDETGAIASVSTERGKDFTADLFIDCTGNHSTLIEKAMDDPWIDWSDSLLCNQAVVGSVPHEGNIRPYTTATAATAGWIWEIPLSHRLSLGYVHSNQFISGEQASEELCQYTQRRGLPMVHPKEISFRVGRRENFWHRNCVAIGLSAGFVEPLESTGLALAAIGVHVLMQTLPDCRMNPALSGEYNRIVGQVYDEVRDFIILHYMLNGRDDEGFWQASRQVPIPNSLKTALDLYDETGLLTHFKKEIFGEPSYYCVCSGNDRLPRNTLPTVSYVEPEKILEVLSQITSQNNQFLEKMPGHSELISDIHRGKGKLL